MAFPQEQRDNKNFIVNNLLLDHCCAIPCGNNIRIKEVNLSQEKTIMLLKMLSCFFLSNNALIKAVLFI